MEHRWNKRCPVTADVTLHHHAHPVVEGKTYDIGPAGMFIQAGPVVYRRNTILDIEFVAPATLSRNDSRRFRLPAIVIHNNDEGMGLMLRETTPEAHEAWKTLCHDTHVFQQAASAQD